MAIARAEARVVRPRDAKILIERCMNVDRPLFLWGPPGIGKSELIAEIGAEQNRPVIDLRLLLMEPTDIKGIPYYDPESCSMRWAKPSELPENVNEETLAHEIIKLKLSLDLDNDPDLLKINEKIYVLELLLEQQHAILFLDELNAAPPSVQAAAYQLILNKRVGEYKLPSGVSIIAAGNRATDKGVTFRMPSPLANRFVHLELDVFFEDWQKWAINHGVRADVVGFLTHHTQHLFNFDPKSPDKAFATPRSWVFVSDLLDDTMQESLNTTLVAGTVGEGMAIQFQAHRKIASKLPLPADVLRGKVTDLNINEISAMYSLTISMCYLLQEWETLARDESENFTLDEWNTSVDYFFRYLMDNFQTEMIILGAKTALRDYNLGIDHRKLKNFKEFHQRYGDYILDD